MDFAALLIHKMFFKDTDTIVHVSYNIDYC